MSKTILLAQGQALQVHLWKLGLESQGHSVVLISPCKELLEVATSQPLDLNLMLVDMTTGLFNPYAFCRGCQSKLPNIPVILTHYPGRHIEPAERRWAIYQGAADVIPGLAEAGDILHHPGASSHCPTTAHPSRRKPRAKRLDPTGEVPIDVSGSPRWLRWPPKLARVARGGLNSAPEPG